MNKLTPKQLEAIGLLAQGLPHTEVSRQLGVSVRTVERWVTRPDIKAAVQEARAKVLEKLGEEIHSKCSEALTRGLPKSIARVLTALDHSDVKVQLKAAELVSKWSGFYQPTSQGKPVESQSKPEENLKDYLQYLANKNGSPTL